MIRVRKRAKSIVAAAVIAGAAMTLSACGDRTKAPPQSSENKTERLIVPSNLTPPVMVESVKGAPEAWDMRNRVAAALRERDIPASTSATGKASYTLRGRARPNREGKNGEVSLVWELIDPNGNKAGEIVQLAAVPETSWLKIKAPDLDAVAEAAAESIAPIVPSAALGGNQFATAGQKVAQRQRVDEETAARKLIKEKGAGPLQKRLAGLAGVDGDRVRKAQAKIEAARREREARRAALREAEEKLAAEEAKLAGEIAAGKQPPEKQAAEKKPEPLVKKEPVKTAKAKPKAAPTTKTTGKTRRKVIDPKVAAALAMKADPRKVIANPGGSSRVAVGGGAAARAAAAKAAEKAAASKTRTVTKSTKTKAAPVKSVRKLDAKPPQTSKAPGQVIDPGAAGELRGEGTRRKLPLQTASRQPTASERGPEFYWVQVGAYGDKATARAQYARMKRQSPVNLRAVPHVIVRGQIGTTPVYRVRIGPFPNRNSAGGRCRNLKADGIDCFLKRTG